ncbi:unnamed protein product [Effrenium voratum]|uniref:Protein DD3-3 n=1 Tax=Effrenium voratum TaxID=2562239 RepID=A0AA36I424_9DINO|nr:unnamed protein product [Effrenium voratum]
MFRLIPALSALWFASADMYLNSPRGSNNKLREQSNNVQNANRLFDSQNNAASGYQIGDDCKPACKDGNNNYDVTVEGATKGTMKFYQGSELYLEWHMQHGCGVGHPNLRCQIILQYMTEEENPTLRDGTNQDSAGGDGEDPTEEESAEVSRGYHEPMDYWQDCIARERNKGLYTADQQMDNNGGATATRQNPNGNGRRRGNQRHGLECPEERDYYPYWHPSPWHDIAILTDEPQERCAYYQTESQNVKAKGYCSQAQYNSPDACQGNGGEWKEQAPFEEPPPDCTGGIASRDNHNGNVRNGQPQYYVWRIPEFLKGRVVLRVRYNITTGDFGLGSLANPKEDGAAISGIKADSFFMDSRFNDPNPGNRRRSVFAGRPSVPVPLAQDPVADWLGLGETGQDTSRLLQLQVNTNQFGRTFEDRTHTFLVVERPADVPMSKRIVNYNVRGRRGNIVQVYPSVEYDFIPANLVVEQGTLLHFQWTGSDANNNNNAGNGRAGTDRSNLVQVQSRSETVPLPIEKPPGGFAPACIDFPGMASATVESQPPLSFVLKGGDKAFINQRPPLGTIAVVTTPQRLKGRKLVDRFAYLDQDTIVTCNWTNCKQLNGASAYFDGGLVEMKVAGTHHVASTRNNDFSNRSHKASITVTGFNLELYENIAVGVGRFAGILHPGGFCFLVLAVYLCVAVHAYRKPGSWVFSRRYRPRILGCCLRKATMEALVEERRQLVAKQRKEWAKRANAHTADEEGGTDKAAEVALPEESMSWFQGTKRCFRQCGLGEQQLTTLMFGVLNVLVFAIGFLSNLSGGFQKSWAYPVAKARALGFHMHVSRT